MEAAKTAKQYTISKENLFNYYCTVFIEKLHCLLRMVYFNSMNLT